MPRAPEALHQLAYPSFWRSENPGERKALASGMGDFRGALKRDQMQQLAYLGLAVAEWAFSITFSVVKIAEFSFWPPRLRCSWAIVYEFLERKGPRGADPGGKPGQRRWQVIGLAIATRSRCPQSGGEHFRPWGCAIEN